MPLIGGSQYYSGFSPQTIPDCVLWLDALDSNTLTLSGSNISAWRDKSGRANNSTGVINTPTRRANSINGRPAVFISSNAVRGSFSNTISNRELHCFMVCTALSTNGSYPRFLGLDDGVNGEYNAVTGIEAIGRQGGANFVVSRLNSGAIVNAADDVPHIVSTFNNISNHSIAVDGSAGVVTASSGTTGNFAISKWNIGCETGGSLQWNPQLYVGEILVFSNALPSNVRYQIEGYLATKWGVTSNLPATHPFRSLPPFMRAFQPTDISGCAVWLDGADSTAMTFSGANIVQWLDKSGNGRHGSNVGTGNPTLGTTVTTGRRTVVMSGSNYFRLSNASTLSVTSASYFVQAYATGSNRTLLSFWNNERILGPTYYWDNATSFSLSPYAWSNTNAVLSVIENSASNCTGHFNGNALTPISYKAAVANSNVILGAHWSLDNFWLGNIQEVILYDVALTPGQRQQVETYLTNKWGTRGATPSGHYARISPALSLPFSPIFIDGCTMWLDSTDRSAITLTGSNVTGLRDKSPANLTLTGTTGFTWPNNTFNGNYPSFFNVNGGLDGVNAASCLGVSTLNLSTPFSVFTVLQKVASAPDGYVMDSGPGGSGRPYTYGSAIITPWASGGFQMSNASVLSMIWTADNLAAGYHNGTVNFTGSVSLTTGGLTIGNRFSVNESWPGHICEFVIFTGALTTVQRQRMEGYMAWRWGLVGQLPSTHPYKSFKP